MKGYCISCIVNINYKLITKQVSRKHVTDESQKHVGNFYIKCKWRDLFSLHVKVYRSTKIPQSPHKPSANIRNNAVETCGDPVNEWPSTDNSRQMEIDQELFTLFRKLNHKNMTEKTPLCLSMMVLFWFILIFYM